MGGLSQNRLIINELGNVFLVKSGSVATGFSQSISERHVFNVSMSSNIGNLHTPSNASSSYFTISSSNLPNTSYNIYFQTSGSYPAYNIKMAPNSSSAGTGYGSLGGSNFAVSHSNQTSYFYYANPETRTRATSSLINIVGMHSSSNENVDSHYSFFISGSAGVVYEFRATASVAAYDYSSYNTAPIIIPFEYHHVSMSLEEATGSGGIEEINGPQSITSGIERLVAAINNNKSTIGANVTASFSSSVITGITFNANSAEVDSTYAFFTQSLQSGSAVTLKNFAFSGATHISSSAPIVSSNDSVYPIPLAFTSSEWNVMTASRAAIQLAYPPNLNVISASLSGSETAPGGFFINTFQKTQQANLSGSMNPLFEFVMTSSGSAISVPPDPTVATNVAIEIGEFDTPTLVSSTVLQLNSYFLIGSNTPVTSVRGYPFLSGSVIDASNFSLGTPPAAIRGDITSKFNSIYARQITGSTIQSGSGTVIGGTFQEGDAATGSAETLMSFQFDPLDRSSAVISGSAGQMFYMSGSGDRMGFNTSDPSSDIDLRADEFQVRSKSSPKGVRVNKEGNIESFSSDASAAATGSEFILNYSRGVSITEEFINVVFGANTVSSDEEAVVYFSELSPEIQASVLEKGAHAGLIVSAAVGDVLGSIRWVAESGSSDFGSRELLESRDSRVAGEAARIEVVVNTSEDVGITSDMIFKLAVQPESAPQQVLRLDAGAQHELTGSLRISNDITVSDDLIIGDDASFGGNIEVGGTITSVGNIIANGSIVGDNATDISQIRNLNIIGGAILGNHSSDTHTITGTTSHVGDISVTGDVSSSGTITANTFVGTRVILEHLSIYQTNIEGPHASFHYGSGVGSEAGGWSAAVTDPTNPASNTFLNGYILPFKMKNISAKVVGRSQANGIPTFWLYTGSRVNSDDAHDLGWAASSSVAVGSATNAALNMDITGSKAFTPNDGDDVLYIYVSNAAANSKTMRFTAIVYGEAAE